MDYALRLALLAILAIFAAMLAAWMGFRGYQEWTACEDKIQGIRASAQRFLEADVCADARVAFETMHYSRPHCDKSRRDITATVVTECTTQSIAAALGVFQDAYNRLWTLATVTVVTAGAIGWLGPWLARAAAAAAVW